MILLEGPPQGAPLKSNLAMHLGQVLVKAMSGIRITIGEQTLWGKTSGTSLNLYLPSREKQGQVSRVDRP